MLLKYTYVDCKMHRKGFNFRTTKGHFLKCNLRIQKIQKFAHFWKKQGRSVQIFEFYGFAKLNLKIMAFIQFRVGS